MSLMSHWIYKSWTNILKGLISFFHPLPGQRSQTLATKFIYLRLFLIISSTAEPNKSLNIELLYDLMHVFIIPCFFIHCWAKLATKESHCIYVFLQKWPCIGSFPAFLTESAIVKYLEKGDVTVPWVDLTGMYLYRYLQPGKKTWQVYGYFSKMVLQQCVEKLHKIHLWRMSGKQKQFQD